MLMGPGPHTPDKVCSVVEGQKARWEFSRADHGSQDNLSSVVDAISRDGDSFWGGCHDGRCKTEHIIAAFCCGEYSRRKVVLYLYLSSPYKSPRRKIKLESRAQVTITPDGCT